MSGVVPRVVAPIERITVPLEPRTSAGCCDLAVLFYGRNVAAALRLLLAVAGPPVAFVYGFGRFVGTDLALALVTAILVSKPLGVLTVVATARRTFGGPFESQDVERPRRRTATGRLRDLTRSIATAAAVLSIGALVAATLDDAFGTSRLASLGPRPAAAIILLITALLAARALLFVSERHPVERSVRNGLLAGLALRVLLVTPLGMLFFGQTREGGIAITTFWLPVVSLIAMRRSFGTEQRVLHGIDPALRTDPAGKSHALNDMLGPGLLIATAMVGLFIVVVAGLESALTVLGLPGPVFGPAGDHFDSELFEPNLAFDALGFSPLFAATTFAASLFSYQLGRLAWFFVYIDVRVRRDCWDMELLLAREAKRLEGE